jgi:hypothetical protein
MTKTEFATSIKFVDELFSSVSSPESQLPQGVGPPAQFLKVPSRLQYCRTRRRVLSGSTSIEVVPPPAYASYAKSRGP